MRLESLDPKKIIFKEIIFVVNNVKILKLLAIKYILSSFETARNRWSITSSFFRTFYKS